MVLGYFLRDSSKQPKYKIIYMGYNPWGDLWDLTNMLNSNITINSKNVNFEFDFYQFL